MTQTDSTRAPYPTGLLESQVVCAVKEIHKSLVNDSSRSSGFLVSLQDLLRVAGAEASAWPTAVCTGMRAGLSRLRSWGPNALLFTVVTR